jgi:hypothetical protein
MWVKNSRNKKLRAFYDKKREEGKPYRVALVYKEAPSLDLCNLSKKRVVPRFSLNTTNLIWTKNLPACIRKVLKHVHKAYTKRFKRKMLTTY